MIVHSNPAASVSFVRFLCPMMQGDRRPNERSMADDLSSSYNDDSSSSPELVYSKDGMVGFRVEPIRILPTPRPNQQQCPANHDGDESPAASPLKKRRRVVIDSVSSSINNRGMSSMDHALSIDLIVGYIIGFLPWKDQFSSCRRVSKVWNQASQSSSMRLLLIGTGSNNSKQGQYAIDNSRLPLCLLPSCLERYYNEMTWETASKLPADDASKKVIRLDIYGNGTGDCGFQASESVLVPSRLCHLEELQLRYLSREMILRLIPSISSSHCAGRPALPRLTKLVIQEREKNKSSNMTDLLQRIVRHAPNLQVLHVIGWDSSWQLQDLVLLRHSLRELSLVSFPASTPAEMRAKRSGLFQRLHNQHLSDVSSKIWEEFCVQMPRLARWKVATNTICTSSISPGERSLTNLQQI